MGEKDTIYAEQASRSGIINNITFDGVVNNDWYIDMAVIDERNAVAFLLCLSSHCSEGEQGGDNSFLHKYLIL